MNGECYFELVKSAIDHMVKGGFEIVFIAADNVKEMVLGNIERRNELNHLLLMKKLTCRFVEVGYLRKDIYQQINSH